MSASVSGMRGGQPSTTQPIAGPWLSPKVVTRNIWPKVLNDMAEMVWKPGRAGLGSPRLSTGQMHPARTTAHPARGSLRPLAGCAANDLLTQKNKGRPAQRPAACHSQIEPLLRPDSHDHLARPFESRVCLELLEGLLNLPPGGFLSRLVQAR